MAYLCLWLVFSVFINPREMIGRTFIHLKISKALNNTKICLSLEKGREEIAQVPEVPKTIQRHVATNSYGCSYRCLSHSLKLFNNTTPNTDGWRSGSNVAVHYDHGAGSKVH